MHIEPSRSIYRNNQLAEVICQLRFPQILRIESEAPAAFQEAIRHIFPMYTVRQEMQSPRLSGTPENIHLEKGAGFANHQFATPDGVWRINLTSNFISLSCSQYTCWEHFAARLDKPLAAFIRTYQPALFTRIGLRYINFISRRALGLEDTTYCDLIRPAYLGVLSDGLIPENSASRSTVDAQYLLPDGCQVKLHAGPGMVTKNSLQDKEAKFVFDLDLSITQNQPVQRVADSIQLLHSHAFPIFRNAITDLLHNAMQPE